MEPLKSFEQVTGPDGCWATFRIDLTRLYQIAEGMTLSEDVPEYVLVQFQQAQLSACSMTTCIHGSATSSRQVIRSRPPKIMTDNSKRPTKPMPLFALGQVVATPGALNAITEHDIAPLDLIHRHVTGDWGNLGAEDRQENLLAIRSGRRIFSSYRLSAAKKIWIITEADRSSTTLLLPDEYWYMPFTIRLAK